MKTFPLMSWQTAKFLLGIVLFLGLIYILDEYIGWRQLFSPWAQFSAIALITVLIFTFVTYILRALRLFGYFRTAMPGGFLCCVKLMLLHNLFNNLLPMRVGELSFPILMSRYFSIKVTSSIPALLWFRLLDLHTLIILGLLFNVNWWNENLLFYPMILIVIALPWIFFLSGHWLSRKLESKKLSGVSRIMIKMLKSLPQQYKDLFYSWTLTILIWLVKLGTFTWVLLQFLDAEAHEALIAVIAGDLTSVLPIHGVAGAGTYEAGVVSALVSFGLVADSALIAAVNLHLFFLGATIIGALFSLLLLRTCRTEKVV